MYSVSVSFGPPPPDPAALIWTALHVVGLLCVAVVLATLTRERHSVLAYRRVRLALWTLALVALLAVPLVIAQWLQVQGCSWPLTYALLRLLNRQSCFLI